LHTSLEDFCRNVKGLQKTNAEKALMVLWYHDRAQPGVELTAGCLAKVLDDHHVGRPNSTLLGAGIRKTRLANESKAGFSLKPGSRRLVHDWLPCGIDGIQPEMDHSSGYIPDAIWAGTRGYIEAVCKQLNGCVRSAFYDAAAVMLRRLLETLIIEAYEHGKREAEIKDGGGVGNYFLLKELVERACGEKGHAGLNLGRDTKAALKEARDIGNWSAHARRYLAVHTDLGKIQPGVRVGVQELIQIAGLKKAPA
jgi:hypothetical protein